jgi:hypothetical protein
MLLDVFLPTYDVRTRAAIHVAAPPERVYASLCTADFDGWGLARTLDALRILPTFPTSPRTTWDHFRATLTRPRYGLDDLLAHGFSLLGTRPGEELVLGTVGRFWRARSELHPPNPAHFQEPALSGTAKAAWNFAVGRRPDGTTDLHTETRVLCADAATRRRFRAYWVLIAPSADLIRREMLAAVRHAAESRPRDGAA